MKVQEYYSNGKLLLTAEYAILDGATGLALPTSYGQYLKVKSNSSAIISWKSTDDQDNIWFEAEFAVENLKTLSTSDPEISNRLGKILMEARLLNPSFLSGSSGFTVQAKLTFPRNWGLGSSSTLIANICKWAGDVNPYRLLAATFGGSGYDIACANHDTPIIYRSNAYTPVVHEVDFNPIFSPNLYFIYLNQKKNSRDAIAAYRQLTIDKTRWISQIDEITQAILQCDQLSEFERLLNAHEQLLSKTLQLPTVKASLFPDYPNAIKSLGAWGGDFIIATGTAGDMDYFRKKGYGTMLPYAKMIL